jgi:hypothetical protein
MNSIGDTSEAIWKILGLDEGRIVTLDPQMVLLAYNGDTVTEHIR